MQKGQEEGGVRLMFSWQQEFDHIGDLQLGVSGLQKVICGGEWFHSL